MVFSSTRQFQFWFYHVSHGRMLLRSPISPGEATNIDIVFYAVDYLDIPTHMTGVEFAEPTAEEVSRIERHHGRDFSDSTVFCLASGGKRFFIAALTYEVLENELDLFDSIIQDYPGSGRAIEEFGRVIARAPKAKAAQPAI